MIDNTFREILPIPLFALSDGKQRTCREQLPSINGIQGLPLSFCATYFFASFAKGLSNIMPEFGRLDANTGASAVFFRSLLKGNAYLLLLDKLKIWFWLCYDNSVTYKGNGKVSGKVRLGWCTAEKRILESLLFVMNNVHLPFLETKNDKVLWQKQFI